MTSLWDSSGSDSIEITAKPKKKKNQTSLSFFDFDPFDLK